VLFRSPVSGWNSITNAQDATLGTETEQDESARARRVSELEAAGGSTLAAVRAELLSIVGIESALVLENVTETTDGNGTLPHTIRAVVYDGTPSGTNVDTDTIAQALFDSKPAGARTQGAISTTIRGSDGIDHPIAFSRPTKVDIYIEVDLDVDTGAGWDAVDSPPLVKTAIVEGFEASRKVGDDVIPARFYAWIFSVAGVVDVTEIRLGLTASPTGTANLVIAFNEIADFDTSRIEVAT